MSRVEVWAREELARWEARGLLRVPEVLTSRQGATIRIGNQTLLNFSSNDYLGLAGSHELTEAMQRALSPPSSNSNSNSSEGADANDVGCGTGAGASRLIVGTHALHAALERALADFEGTESALLFNSGYCANVGTLSTLVGEGDAIFSDALNHASLVDGARLSKARVHIYQHASVSDLERLLQGARGFRRKLIVTDSVFSMDGDLAPLRALVELAERYDAALLVDEAHATGLFGERGSGLCEQLGLDDRVDVRIGTLSKAAGSFGAFAAGSKALCALLYQRARALVFTTALPPPVCAVSLRAIEILRNDRERRARLWQNVEHLAKGLRALDIDAEARSPIFPVVMGSPERALEASAQLRERGVLVKAIRPPTVPEGTSRLRFSLSASHTIEQIDRALEALRQVRSQLRLAVDADEKRQLG
jgi:8-amino-7-oxononanoate synthase